MGASAVTLSPLPIARWAHASLGVVLVAIGAGLWRDRFAPEPVAMALAAVLAGVGVVVRSMRMGVDCRDGVVRVRGLVLTRVVPRASIEEVTNFPSLVWRDAKGRRRWTPVAFLFDSPRSLSHIRRHNASELDRLRGWINQRGRSA
jgi:hypothetical protein